MFSAALWMKRDLTKSSARASYRYLLLYMPARHRFKRSDRTDSRLQPTLLMALTESQE